MHSPYSLLTIPDLAEASSQESGPPIWESGSPVMNYPCALVIRFSLTVNFEDALLVLNNIGNMSLTTSAACSQQLMHM